MDRGPRTVYQVQCQVERRIQPAYRSYRVDSTSWYTIYHTILHANGLPTVLLPTPPPRKYFIYANTP